MEEDKEIKESLESLESPWTSVDLYYKGFHIKKSVPTNVSGETLKSMIDKYIELGYEPSWNKDTSQTQLDPTSNWPDTKKKYVCKICGADAEYKEGISKSTGKPWKAIFCKKNKDHTEWGAVK